MVDLRRFADRILHCHRSMLKVGRDYLDPARRYSYCVGAAGGGLRSELLARQFHGTEVPPWGRSSSILGVELKKAAIFTLIRRCFHGIEPPSERRWWPDCFNRESLLLGGKGFEKSAAFSSSTKMMRRCFSSTCEVAVVDEETQITSRLSSSPLLMVPPGLVSDSSGDETESDFENDYFHLYNVSENKMLKLKRDNKIRLPWQRDILSANEATCVGSSHGWLAFSHPHNCSLFLFNPLLLSSSEFPYLPLPPVETLPSVISSVRRRKEDRDSIVMKYSVPWGNPVSAQQLSSGSFVNKLILSSSPFPFLSNYDHRHQEDITVMAILGYRDQKLAFCKVGDRSWTALDCPLQYKDVVYFSKHQLFYALDGCPFSVAVEAWDLRDPTSPKSSLITNFSPPRIQPTMDKQQQHLRTSARYQRMTYLVESCSGDLLMVIRYACSFVDDQRNFDISRAWKTVAFDVYKLDFDSVSHKNKKKWVYMTCLGDEALFVGQKDSFSLSASNFPGLSNNSIYFTPYSEYYGSQTSDYGGQDLGIFSLEDGSITPFFHCDSNFKKNQPAPVWIIPKPQL